MSWDITRRQVRNLETKLDASLNQYSRLAVRISGADQTSSWPGSDPEEGRNGNSSKGGIEALRDQDQVLQNEISRSLNELSLAVEKLTTTLDDPAIPPSSSQMYAVQRHREVLLDFERDFRRSNTNVKQALDRRDLLGSVKVDIDTYRSQHANNTDSLLAERGRIDNSHSMIDGTLEQAYATRADLASQRSTLQDMTSRMSTTANQIPGLNNLIRLISRRRRRDSIIMGSVIGICTVLLLLYLTR